MPRVVAYQTTDDVPEHLRWVAYFTSKNGFLPIRFSGATEAEVRETAVTWWEEESAKKRKSARTQRIPAKSAGGRGDNEFADLL